MDIVRSGGVDTVNLQLWILHIGDRFQNFLIHKYEPSSLPIARTLQEAHSYRMGYRNRKDNK